MSVRGWLAPLATADGFLCLDKLNPTARMRARMAIRAGTSLVRDRGVEARMTSCSSEPLKSATSSSLPAKRFLTGISPRPCHSSQRLIRYARFAEAALRRHLLNNHLLTAQPPRLLIV